jgi:hypothetical protein
MVTQEECHTLPRALREELSGFRQYAHTDEQRRHLQNVDAAIRYLKVDAIGPSEGFEPKPGPVAARLREAMGMFGPGPATVQLYGLMAEAAELLQSRGIPTLSRTIEFENGESIIQRYRC